MVHQNWWEVIANTIVPNISFEPEYITIIVAIFGTTISPYLFFWQANEEVEVVEEKMRVKKLKRHIVTKHELRNMRGDVTAGMFFSNIVMFFIISTAASTLYVNGIHDIKTADQAAQALRPFAGDLSGLLFALGIVGTGLLGHTSIGGKCCLRSVRGFWVE